MNALIIKHVTMLVIIQDEGGINTHTLQHEGDGHKQMHISWWMLKATRYLANFTQVTRQSDVNF